MWTKIFRPHLSTNLIDFVKISRPKDDQFVVKTQIFREFSQLSGSPTEGFPWATGAGNNPMVGMTVSVAVAVEESLKG